MSLMHFTPFDKRWWHRDLSILQLQWIPSQICQSHLSSDPSFTKGIPIIAQNKHFMAKTYIICCALHSQWKASKLEGPRLRDPHNTLGSLQCIGLQPKIKSR